MLAISRMTSFELVFIPNHCAFTCILQVNFKMHKICYSKLSCHMLSLSPPFEVFYCFFRLFLQDTHIQRSLTCYREDKGEISTATSDVLAMIRQRERFAQAGGKIFFKYMLTIDILTHTIKNCYVKILAILSNLNLLVFCHCHMYSQFLFSSLESFSQIQPNFA